MNILFPIETLIRELDYKLILAHSVAKSEKNVVCYVGAFQNIHRLAKHFKGGLYVGKTIFTRLAKDESRKHYKQFKKNDFDIIYLHEEGAVWQGNEDDWIAINKSLYDVNSFDENDVVCVWGDFQKQIDLNRTSKPVRIEVTGHPRFDLNRNYNFLYEKEAKRLKDKYGDFLLVNGNFSIANHGVGIDEILKINLSTETDFFTVKKRILNKYTDNCLRLGKMVELVVKIASSYPSMNIVYRPHPSEGLEFYRKVFSGIANIHVIQSETVGPFIIASKILLHDGCSTSLEAYAANKLVINYKPVSSEYDYYLPNHIGYTLKTEESVLELINKSYSSDSWSAPLVNSDKALALFKNFTNENTFKLFTSVIVEKIRNKRLSSIEGPSNLQIQVDYLRYKIRVALFKLKNTVLSNADKLKRIKYIETKYPGMRKESIEDKIEKLNISENSKVKVDFINPYLIRLYLGE